MVLIKVVDNKIEFNLFFFLCKYKDIMGKTFRKNNGTSISESWSENKHRDFARNRKRSN